MKVFLYLLLLFSTCITAQINESDTLKLKANLSLTGFYQGGNVETLIFRAKSGLSFKPWKKWVFKTQNSFVYQEFGKEKADADILSLNFLYFNPDRKIYPLVLAIVSTNFRREIDFRSLLGAGVNFQIISTENSWLKLPSQVNMNKPNLQKLISTVQSMMDNNPLIHFEGRFGSMESIVYLKKN